MTRRITDLSDPTWQSLFTDLRSSWFRLETLQKYAVDYEANEYRDFLRTGRLERPDDGDWQRMISAHTDAGRNLRRVHVVEEPLSDYVRYEIAAYEHNAEAGEDIRLVVVERGAWPSGLPRGEDFWIFDDTDVWTMHYENDGRFLAAEQLTDPDHITRCRQWRDTALAQSIPLATYTSRAA